MVYLNYYLGVSRIITFEEYIAIALNADRIVGIYPEIKNPVFINKHVCISFRRLLNTH